MKRLSILLLLLLIVACEKTEKSPVPYAPVRFEVDFRFLDKKLSVPGSLLCETYTKPRDMGEMVGYAGILVISGSDAYYAYDLCCPYEAQRDIKVEPYEVGKAKCPKCGSVYEIEYGTGAPVSGPSKYRLVRLNVTQTANGLYIDY